ncbi:MAG: hypothetical protein ACE14T_10485 [Syntrophales bacterium]
MALFDVNRNFNDVINNISSLRRRSQLTGQPFTTRDVANVMEPAFAAAREAAPANAALNLQKQAIEQQGNQFERSLAETNRQAAERIGVERANAEDAINQARRMGLLQTGVSGTGAGLLGYHLLKDAGIIGGTTQAALPAAQAFTAANAAAPVQAAAAMEAGVGGGVPVAGGGFLSAAQPYLLPAAATYGGAKLAELTSETKEIPQEVSEIGSTIASIIEAPFKKIGGK